MTGEISTATANANANSTATFGSSKVVSSDFESFFNNLLNSATEEGGSEADALASLMSFAGNEDKSEVLMQLQMILGEDIGTEAFERIISLLENGTLSVQMDNFELSKEDFENLANFILERLDIAIKQMTQQGENGDFSEREKFLNLITDLLKTGIITPEEYETAVQNPEISSLPQLFNELKKEAQSLLAALKNSDAPNKEFTPDNPLINSLAQELGIQGKELEEFYSFINDLIQNGLITMQDLEIKSDYAAEIEFSDIDTEELEPYIMREMVKGLWTSAKEGNDVKSQEILAVLKQVAEIRAEAPDAETKELLEKIEKTDKEHKKGIFTMLKDIVENREESKLQRENTTAGKIAEKNVQPEVRAVWEADGLKIETVNPKTGEKLQTVQTSLPGSMQQRIQEYEIIKQVVAQAKFITTPTGEQRMTMHLHPEHLGSMDLRITLNNGEMQIHARVDTAVAQHALENQIGLLREGLEKQGINLERLEVSVEQRDKQDAYSLSEREQNERRERGKHRRGKETHLTVSVKKNATADTGRRLGYNTMEYLA